MHYQRWAKFGDPEHIIHIHTKSLEEALAVRASWDGDCLVWDGSLNRDGYATYCGHESKLHGTTRLHRIMWEREKGKIPPGMEIDHLCGRRNCLRVDHFRLADRSMNTSNLQGLRVTNKSGVRGVFWDKTLKKYVAKVTYQKVVYKLGNFDNLEEAAKIVEAKRAELYVGGLP